MKLLKKNQCIQPDHVWQYKYVKNKPLLAWCSEGKGRTDVDTVSVVERPSIVQLDRQVSTHRAMARLQKAAY